MSENESEWSDKFEQLLERKRQRLDVEELTEEQIEAAKADAERLNLL
jgi:hypothetical protein